MQFLRRRNLSLYGVSSFAHPLAGLIALTNLCFSNAWCAYYLLPRAYYEVINIYIYIPCYLIGEWVCAERKRGRRKKKLESQQARSESSAFA